jgi:hypothetical protein
MKFDREKKFTDAPNDLATIAKGNKKDFVNDKQNDLL